MHFNRLLSGLALALLASMSGCGGGGGAPIGGGATPPPPPPPTSGLVPVAGTVGATLYADAAPLRVLRDGAVWTYRGVDLPLGAGGSPDTIRA